MEPFFTESSEVDSPVYHDESECVYGQKVMAGGSAPTEPMGFRIGHSAHDAPTSPSDGIRQGRVKRSIAPVPVKRGPELASTSLAIVAAIEADAEAAKSARKPFSVAASKRIAQ